MAITRLQCNERDSDFGAEESFGQAAKRFEEHYGWAIDRATVRREVEHTAHKAEQYVEMRLLSSRLDYSQPLETRPGNEQLVVELDGCHIRTGKKVTIAGAEVTKKGRLPRSQRPPDWREVRVGLARPLFAEGRTNLRGTDEQVPRSRRAIGERCG